MASDIEAKIDLITSMVTSLGKLTNVEARLRFAGDAARADQVRQKHDELRDAIDTLRGKVADQWTQDAAQIEAEITKRNAKVQASVRNIQKKIDIAENVVKIIGQVDDAIQAVAGLVI